VRSARAILRRVIDLQALALGHVLLTVVLWRSRGRAVTVLDIDNTLADSWPTLTAPVASERERLAGLALLPGMRATAHDPAIATGDVVVYLSHRPLWFAPLTLHWLRSAGYDASPLRVILVPSAAAKIGFLRRLADGSRQVDYWDDLSHGTERGTTELYAEVIDAVRSLPVTYHGLDEIAAVVSAAAPPASGR